MKIKDYFILGLIGLVVILFILRGCNKPIHDTTEVHFRDTIQVQTIKIDTITVHHTKLLQGKVDTLILSDSNNYTTKYYYPIKDTALEGMIEVKSNDRPEVDFKYKLFNKEITNTITIKDSVHTETIINRNQLYFGSEVVLQPLFSSAYIGLSFKEKHGNLFEVSGGYDFNNKYPLVKVGYKKLISFRKK